MSSPNAFRRTAAATLTGLAVLSGAATLTALPAVTGAAAVWAAEPAPVTFTQLVDGYSTLDTQITATGTAEPGWPVSLRVAVFGVSDDTLTTTAAGDGTWSIALPEQQPGTQVYLSLHQSDPVDPDNWYGPGQDIWIKILSPDTDGDGWTDQQEGWYGTDPANPDTDGDQLLDGEEGGIYGTDPLKADTDDDQLSDYDELFTYSTDPLKADTDGDQLLDGAEFVLGCDVFVRDTDGDGLPDGFEAGRGLDCTSTDSDNDGLDDVYEAGHDTARPNPDWDGDGLRDGDEVNVHGTDYREFDTDWDGYSDGAEIAAGTDPLDRNSFPTDDTDGGDGQPTKPDHGTKNPDSGGQSDQGNDGDPADGHGLRHVFPVAGAEDETRDVTDNLASVDQVVHERTAAPADEPASGPWLPLAVGTALAGAAGTLALRRRRRDA